MLGDLTRGAGYLIKGGKLMLKPRLRQFVIAPLAINIVIFSLAIYWLVGLFSQSLSEFGNFANEWTWVQWLTSFAAIDYIMTGILSIIWLFFSLGTLLIVGYTFSLIANVIAAPFNGVLAENCEALIEGTPLDNQLNLKEIIAHTPRIIAAEISKILYLVWWIPILLILSFIPVINVITPVLWFVFGAWMMALEYMDYPMGNHQFLFKSIRKNLKNKRVLALGFGGSIAALSSIPLINLFIMPAAVCGATSLWIDHRQILSQN